VSTVLITGSSRGIGLGLARAYAARGWRVIATCRSPGTADQLAAMEGEVSVQALDVTDTASIAQLAESLAGTPIDLLINNAGIGGAAVGLGNMDLDRWRLVLETNLLGPAKVVDAFLPHVRAGTGRKIVNISSTLGSIARASGGNYAYRSSKAALNMTMRAIARDLVDEGIICVLLSPGIVDTHFTRGGRMPKIPVEESVAGLLRVIDGLTRADAGAFLRYTGDIVEW
jgi:NAD(P)-dependent dehydrogenase (short-subunit alcohol dehydrogenase family)